MIELALQRWPSTAHGTAGVLGVIGQFPFAVTLEPPWINNQVNISCIPTGEYTCERIDSPRFGETFAITNVPGRTHILFHKGNREKDTLGCVLVGENYGFLAGEPAVLSSGAGFSEFMALLRDRDEFSLEVT